MIIAEYQDGKLNEAAMELLTKARALFGQDSNIAFSLAGNNIGECVELLRCSGADAVYYMEDERLERYHPEYTAAAMTSLAKSYDPDVLLIGATSAGEEMAPTLGSRLATGVAAHCVDLIMKDDMFIQMVPAFGGKVIGEIFTPNHRPSIASVKPGIFREEPQEPRPCETYKIASDVLGGIDSKITWLGSEKKEIEGIPIEGASLVVCGGNGIGGAEGWAELEKLASLLGAAVGCTRPVIDNGWVNNERGMIGTSGKSIRPNTYLGFGISGATHHLCGFKDAGTIISINNNKEADIFCASDYFAVADATSLIRTLLEQLSE